MTFVAALKFGLQNSFEALVVHDMDENNEQFSLNLVMNFLFALRQRGGYAESSLCEIHTVKQCALEKSSSTRTLNPSGSSVERLTFIKRQVDNRTVKLNFPVNSFCNVNPFGKRKKRIARRVLKFVLKLGRKSESVQDGKPSKDVQQYFGRVAAGAA